MANEEDKDKQQPEADTPAAQGKGGNPRRRKPGGSSAERQAESSKPVEATGGTGAAPTPKPAAERTSTKSKAAGEGARSSSGGGFAGWVALLLVLALAGGGYWLWQQLQQSQQQLVQMRESLSGELSRTGRTAEQLTTEINRLQEQLAESARERRSMEEALQALRERVGRREAVIELAEAELLLVLANRQLRLTRDVQTAIAALQEADDRLRQAAEPGLIPVREAIAREIEALRAAPRVDKAGLSARLGALMERVDQLPLPGASRPQAPQPTDATSPRDYDLTTWQGWRELGEAVWEDILSLFTFRRGDATRPPLTAPEERFFLRQNLRLKLETARTALLEEQPAIYRQTLNEGTAWLDEYFPEAPAVTALREQLRTLATADIRPELPELGAALQRLRAVTTEAGN